MLFNVPQYIDVEDKIAGPLTVKQLLWMIALGVILLIMWFSFAKPVFFIVGIPVVLVFAALAFYKPYGQPLISFVFAGIMYIFGSKIYVWKRTPPKRKTAVTNEQKKTVEAKKEFSGAEERRQLALKNLGSIAKILDSSGAQSDSEVVDMLKKPGTRK